MQRRSMENPLIIMLIPKFCNNDNFELGKVKLDWNHRAGFSNDSVI